MGAMRVWSLVMMTAGACAEVAGTVQAQRPADLPLVWAGMANDALGTAAGRNEDDCRSNALGVQARFGRLALIADHALLTDKAAASPARLDELTLATAWIPWRADRGWAAVGVGLRLRGDLGGESLQNRWHDWSDVARVDGLPYEEPSDDTVAVCTTSGTWHHPLSFGMTLPGIESGMNLVEIGWRGLAASDGTWQGAVDALLCGRGLDGAVWAGLRYEDGEVGTVSPTLETVQDHERGLWLVYGVSVGACFFQAGSNLKDGGGFGRLGFAHGREAPVALAGEADLDGDLTWSPGPVVGMDLAWTPDAWSPPWALRCAVRFGNAGEEWQDNVVEFRQISLGPAVAAALVDGDGTLGLEAYGGTGFGLRQDRVVIRGDNAPFPEEENASAVLDGRCGLRLVWGDHRAPGRTVRLGLVCGAVAWVPFSDAEVSANGRSETYGSARVLPELALSARARW